MKFYAKSSVNLIARLAILHPKTTFFIKVFSFVFLVPEKHIIFAKVQRRIKSKIRLSYRLSFKLLVVNQSNMLQRKADYVMNIKQVADYLGISMDAVRKRCQRGQLPFHRSASRLYFSRMEIDDTILDRELLTKFA